MSKHTAPFARCLQVATLFALAAATPAMAACPPQPAAQATQTAVLVKAASPSIRMQSALAMNVTLTCVRSGPRMVC